MAWEKGIPPKGIPTGEGYLPKTPAVKRKRSGALGAVEKPQVGSPAEEVGKKAQASFEKHKPTKPIEHQIITPIPKEKVQKRQPSKRETQIGGLVKATMKPDRESKDLQALCKELGIPRSKEFFAFLDNLPRMKMEKTDAYAKSMLDLTKALEPDQKAEFIDFILSQVIEDEGVSKAFRNALDKEQVMRAVKSGRPEVLAKTLLQLSDETFQKVLAGFERGLPSVWQEICKAFGVSHELIEALPKMKIDNINQYVGNILDGVAAFKPDEQEKFIRFLSSKIGDATISKKFQEAVRLEQYFRKL